MKLSFQNKRSYSLLYCTFTHFNSTLEKYKYRVPNVPPFGEFPRVTIQNHQVGGESTSRQQRASSTMFLANSKANELFIIQTVCLSLCWILVLLRFWVKFYSKTRTEDILMFIAVVGMQSPVEELGRLRTEEATLHSPKRICVVRNHRRRHRQAGARDFATRSRHLVQGVVRLRAHLRPPGCYCANVDCTFNPESMQ